MTMVVCKILFCFLVAAQITKNSHILLFLFFSFLKIVQHEIWSCFNSKFGLVIKYDKFLYSFAT